MYHHDQNIQSMQKEVKLKGTQIGGEMKLDLDQPIGDYDCLRLSVCLVFFVDGYISLFLVFLSSLFVSDLILKVRGW